MKAFLTIRQYLSVGKDKFNNIQSLFIKRIIKSVILSIVLLLTTNILLNVIKIDSDYLYFLSNKVKTDFFIQNPEYAEKYTSNDLFFTFEYSYSKAHFRNETEVSEGVFKYTILDSGEIIEVSWTMDEVTNVICIVDVMVMRSQSKDE